MSNIGDFITECAQTMNEGFFGRQVDLRRQTALGDYRQTKFEGVSALDLVCEYIHNNLLNLRDGKGYMTFATEVRPSFMKRDWHFTVRSPESNGQCTIDIHVGSHRRISRDEAFGIILSDEFDEKLHNLLRNVVYSERKRYHKYVDFSGRVRSQHSGYVMASVADMFNKTIMVGFEGDSIEICISFADFGVSSTTRDDVMDDDGRPRANIGHVDGGIFADLDRTVFSNVRPNLPD